jgi:hypothetical protein
MNSFTSDVAKAYYYERLQGVVEFVYPDKTPEQVIKCMSNKAYSLSKGSSRIDILMFEQTYLQGLKDEYHSEKALGETFGQLKGVKASLAECKRELEDEMKTNHTSAEYYSKQMGIMRTKLQDVDKRNVLLQSKYAELQMKGEKELAEILFEEKCEKLGVAEEYMNLVRLIEERKEEQGAGNPYEDKSVLAIAKELGDPYASD